MSTIHGSRASTFPSMTRTRRIPSTNSTTAAVKPLSCLSLALLTACAPGEGAVPAAFIRNGVTVALASPVGYVKVGDRRIAWHPSPGITRYEVVVSDSVETPLFKEVTADTQVVIPPTMQYSLSQNYRWYVTAFRDSDSTAWRSPVAIFRLEGEGRRMPAIPKR